MNTDKDDKHMLLAAKPLGDCLRLASLPYRDKPTLLSQQNHFS